MRQMGNIHKSKEWKYKKHQQYVIRKTLKKMCHKRNSVQVVHDKLSLCSPSFKMQQLLEYHVFFGKDAEDINVEKIISQIPRMMIFRFVNTLNNIYGKSTIDKLELFFSHDSINNRNFVQKRIASLRKLNPQKEYVFCSDMTCLEIMRFAFSVPMGNIDMFIEEETGEMLFFKLLLTINEKVIQYEPINDGITSSKLLFLISSINPVVKMYDKQDIYDRIIYQLESSIIFFRMLVSKQKYTYLYDEFLKRYNIPNWEDYVLTIYGLLIAGNYRAGFVKGNLEMDLDHILSKNVLKTISVPYDVVIGYSAKDKDNRLTNSDYRVFRDKPIVEMQNGDFFIYSMEFLIDRLFNSLYFEFLSYNQPDGLKVNINNLFTDLFCEQILFDSFLDKSIDSTVCRSLNEVECNDIHIQKKKQLGPPDYIIYDGDSLILFR